MTLSKCIECLYGEVRAQHVRFLRPPCGSFAIPESERTLSSLDYITRRLGLYWSVSEG